MASPLEAKDIVSQDELWEMFDYDPETGDLTKKDTGHICGSRRKEGTKLPKHILVHINNEPFLAHRVIWTMVHGQIPDGMTIDHINLDGRDNRISNLRLATISQQLQNRNTWTKSGVKGVYFGKKGVIYSTISVGGKLTYLGSYATIEEAAAEYEEAARKYQGQFARPTSVSSAA